MDSIKRHIYFIYKFLIFLVQFAERCDSSATFIEQLSAFIFDKPDHDAAFKFVAVKMSTYPRIEPAAIILYGFYDI